MTVPDDTELIM